MVKYFITLLLACQLACSGQTVNVPTFVLPNNTSAKQCELPRFIVASRDMGPEAANLLCKAGDYWNQALGKRVFMCLGMQSNEIIEMIQTVVIQTHWADQAEFSSGHVAANYAGYVDMRNGCLLHAVIRVGDSYIGDWEVVETLLRHELGHALGLTDSITFGRLMLGGLDDQQQHPQDAAPEEIEALKELYGE